MGSFEDLRDLYKSSTKSKHLEIKSNGSTYSNAYRNEIYRRGNLITKQNYNREDNMNELDEKYSIGSSNVTYSMNKKGRWRMALDLAHNMSNFAEDDLDIRLYETRDRLVSGYSDCISFQRSKGNGELKVRSTYANKDSIKKGLLLEAQRAKNPTNENEIKIKRGKSKSSSKKKDDDFEPEHIVIDLNDDDDDESSYSEYNFQYPPKMEVLKYNTLFDTKRKDRVSSKITKNVLGDELNKKSLKNVNYLENSLEDIDYDYDEELEEDYTEILNKQNKMDKVMTLHDLINLYTKPIVENRQKDIKKMKVIKDEVNEKELRKLIFISRQNSRIESKQTVRNTERAPKSQNSVTSMDSKIVEPASLVLRINKNTLSSEKLKEKFGIKYCEAFNAWPRIIAINLNDDVNEEISYVNKSTNDAYDVKAWLTIKEIPKRNLDEIQNENSYDEYLINVKVNLNDGVINLDSINTNNEWEFDDLYQKIIQAISKLPIKSFKLKQKVTKSTFNNETVVSELPNIAAKSLCKEAEELKLELLNKNNSDSEADSNSDATSFCEIDVDEIKVKEKLDELFKNKTFSCNLCYEENLSIENSTILLNCGDAICDSCWKNYIDALMNNSFTNAGKLACPVCDVELELALIINFVSDVNKFEQYLTASIDQVLVVMANYRWCQSPGCNKAIKVDLSSTPYGVLSCECGYKTCLKCNKEPHFPAKCSQLANYYNELKAKNHFLIPKNEITTSIGKKCPSCGVFMEKNGGCNQMTCAVCKVPFCWNCVNTWTDHLKLTGGQHSCSISQTTKKTVTIEFKKDKKPIRPADAANYYQNCIYHRELRSKQNARERNANIKRLLGTIKRNELCFDLNTNFEDLSLHEKCKIEIQKRQEIRQFLQKMVSFLNELHFVCEHSYLLLKDHNVQKNYKNMLLSILHGLETICWKIGFIFESYNGIKAISELEELMKKGLNCLNAINNLNIK